MSTPAPGSPVPASTAPVATPAAPAAAKPVLSRGGARHTLSSDDLKDRIRRAQSSVLKELLGTDDATAIRERLAKVDAIEKQAEEAKRAQMTETQKMQHDIVKARGERDRYRTELAMAQEREVMREQSVFVERIAGGHVNPAALEEASVAFARAVSKTDPKIVAKWTERDINTWFKSYVARKPFMGRTAAPSAEPQRRVVERPGGAMRPAPRPTAPASSQANGGKTFRPGQPNSMTRAESREEAKRRGYNWLDSNNTPSIAEVRSSRHAGGKRRKIERPEATNPGEITCRLF